MSIPIHNCITLLSNNRLQFLRKCNFSVYLKFFWLQVGLVPKSYLASVKDYLPVTKVLCQYNARVLSVYYCRQCWGSVTFWYGSVRGYGSSDQYLLLTTPDADPGGPKTYGSYGSRSGCRFGNWYTYSTSFVKGKKLLGSYKTVEIKGFLTSFA